MPNLIILMLLILGFPLVIMLIGDKWINRLRTSLSLRMKYVGDIPNRLVTSFASLFNSNRHTYNSGSSRFRQQTHEQTKYANKHRYTYVNVHV